MTKADRRFLTGCLNVLVMAIAFNAVYDPDNIKAATFVAVSLIVGLSLVNLWKYDGTKN